MKILVVDDHSLFRQGLIAALQSRFPAAEFLEASNGQEAWELVEKMKPDLVILDIQMPKMDGIQVLKKIKEKAPRTKVIMLTQFNDRALISYCLQLGANAFLEKTIESDELEMTINKVHWQGYYFGPFIDEIIKQQLNQSRIWANLDISPRELQVLSHLADGEISSSIAEKLDLSLLTIETYRKDLLQKTKVRNVAELISLAYRTGILITAREN